MSEADLDDRANAENPESSNAESDLEEEVEDSSDESEVRRPKRRRAARKPPQHQLNQVLLDINHGYNIHAGTRLSPDIDSRGISKDRAGSNNSRTSSQERLMKRRHTTVYDAVRLSRATADEILASRVSGLQRALSKEYGAVSERDLPSSELLAALHAYWSKRADHIPGGRASIRALDGGALIALGFLVEASSAALIRGASDT
ncbi:hypothetical protein BZA70DRAFT_204898 [Myxozyma melibiosi]|uniref:Uncharacterized protein n=1 Tax=Myxozyma melibiosi TaxID=54550 RepID=A0ABR1F2X1_9ASCO